MSFPDDAKAYNLQLIEEVRANGRSLGERPLLLLTTTGARSGQPHTVPMMYVPDRDRLLVIASNDDAVYHPDWYHNLAADPHVTVEVAGAQYEARAVVTAGEERERLWTEIVAHYPFFRGHQAQVERIIPVGASTRTEK
jgi:deazaflavin-dependent oxidoreductase (nitroreductase family)